MFHFVLPVRVRYAETDRMGYVYHGNYAQYYEIARVEALRSLGIRYRDLEERGVLLPVLELTSKFIRPAYYDDLLTVHLTVKELPETRVTFHHEIKNESGDTINVGRVTLVFVDGKSFRPTKADADLVKKFEPYFP